MIFPIIFPGPESEEDKAKRNEVLPPNQRRVLIQDGDFDTFCTIEIVPHDTPKEQLPTLFIRKPPIYTDVSGDRFVRGDYVHKSILEEAGIDPKDAKNHSFKIVEILKSEMSN